MSSDDDGAFPEDFTIEQKLIHSEYHPRFYHNDIGLIKLGSSVTFREDISPICLPLLNQDVEADGHAGQLHTAAGWGTTRFRGPTSDVLKEIPLRVLSNEDCSKKYERFRNVRITDSKICARDELETGSACQGTILKGPFALSLFWSMFCRLER